MAAVNRSMEPPRAGGSQLNETHQVLFVTYHFPPSMEMGGQTCAQIARYLPLYSWEPVVLTVNERYAELAGDALEREFPGRVLRTSLLPHPLTFYRYLKSKLHSERKGAMADVVRSEDSGRLRRWLLSLLLVGDAYLGWIPPATLAGLKATRGNRVRHLLSSGPPWTCHLVGLLLSHITGLPWIAHFRDPWSQARVTPEKGLPMRVNAALERMVIDRATFVVCVTNEHTETLRRAYPEFPKGKFHTIPNGFDGREWEDLDAKPEWENLDAKPDPVESRKKTKFTITYTGQLYQARNPLPLFRALRQLIDAGDIDRERFQVELIGWCDLAEGRRVADIAEDCGLADCIHVRGPRNRLETLRSMSKANLLLLLAEGWTVQIPGKTYEYMRAGRPILALTSKGALADLLRSTGGASVVDPHDVAGISAVVRETYRHWKEGRSLAGADPAVVAHFDRRVLAGRFAQLFAKSVLPVDSVASPR